MSPHSNTQRLKELMSQHELRISDVAKLLGRSPQTVKEWRCQNDNNISNNNLELLSLKLAARGVSA
jgi:transcriptional regulator with XRE-family HTH domain